MEELTPEISEYLDSLDSDTREIFVQYIKMMIDEYDWPPAYVHNGIWFSTDGYYSNEVLIDAEGHYSIYYLDSYSKEDQERIREIFSSWSAELSEDGQPRPL